MPEGPCGQRRACVGGEGPPCASLFMQMPMNGQSHMLIRAEVEVR